MILGIPVWYIDPTANTLPSQLRSYHALALIQLIPTTLVTTPISSQPQQEPTPGAKESRQGGKAKRKESKDKAPQAPPTPRAPNLSPLCALCKVVRNATNNFFELPCLKPLVHEVFPKSDIPEVQITLSRLAKTCDLCDHHGHYSHYFPCLHEFRDFLQVLRQYETTHIGSPIPLPMDFGIAKPK